jgi:repressor of nif and glnA expression
MMAERFVLSDRAVQYYLSYLDQMGFTEKVGNLGRILTKAGLDETDNALVGDRIGFIISKLEKLAYRTTFDPGTGTGEVAYNLTFVPEDNLEPVIRSFDEIRKAGCGFFSSFRIIDRDPRLPPGYKGIATICSITMDGVLQRNGIPVKMAYGGRLAIEKGVPQEFIDLIGYRGQQLIPSDLYSAGLTSLISMSPQRLALPRKCSRGPSRKKQGRRNCSLYEREWICFRLSWGQVFNLPSNPTTFHCCL